MRTIRSWITVLGIGALLGGVTRVADAQQSYSQTLYWGSGLIDIPVAWVAPLSGDFAINYSGKRFETDPAQQQKINYSNSINSQLVISGSLFGRLEGGFAAFSSNPEYGFFGRALLLREEDFATQTGWVRWLVPSIAIGARNLGPYEQIDRFGIGYTLVSPAPGSPNQRHEADSLHQDFNTAPTYYTVLTKGFSLNELRGGWPPVDLSLSVGYGNGLFRDHGSIPRELYAKHPTGGAFFGAKMEFVPTAHLRMSVMAENNAWDYNVGTTLQYRGILAGLYLTELGAGSSARDTSNRGSSFIYNYSKVAFTLGWQSNIYALLKGNVLQNRAAELERRRQTLLAEIAQRQQRIAGLELEINRYEAQNLLELEQRRAQVEAALRAEREALQRLEERLRRIEQQQPQQTPPPRD